MHSTFNASPANDEKQISEVKDLLNLYCRYKLDAAIDKEAMRNYSAEVYEAWLKTKESDNPIHPHLPKNH